jgi:hypothetical protein
MHEAFFATARCPCKCCIARHDDYSRHGVHASSPKLAAAAAVCRCVQLLHPLADFKRQSQNYYESVQKKLSKSFSKT